MHSTCRIGVPLLCLCSVAGWAGDETRSQTRTTQARASIDAKPRSDLAPSGGSGFGDWIFTHSFEISDQIPVAVRVYPGDWPRAWIGARRQFIAAVTNANGQPIDGLVADWSTSDDSAISIDERGLATALRSGSAFEVFASFDMMSDAAPVSVAYDGSSAPGIMFTAWFARSDNAPAILADGQLELPYLDSFYSPRAVPQAPWPAGGRNASNVLIEEVRPTIAKFQWEGDVIGLLTDVVDGVGTFRARGRVGEWTNLAVASALDFQLEGNRIAVLLEDGSFRVKQGVSGAWTNLVAPGGDVRSFQLEGNLIGVLHESGQFRVKEGMDGPWTVLATEGSDARSFLIADSFISVFHESGLFRIKQGIDGPWTILASEGSGVVAYEIEGQLEYDDEDNLILVPYIGLLHEGGMLRVKRTINGAWTVLSNSGVASFQLEDNPYRDAAIDMIRIGVLHDDGTFRVKERVDGPWTVLAAAGTGVRSFQFQDNLIGVLFEEGLLRVKLGIDGAWVSTPAYGPGVTQYRLLVDVPAKPERTSLVNYALQQERCANQHANFDYTCHPVYQDGILDLVPLYGRFCGAGRPAEFGNYDWDWAIGEGPVDALDWTCRHHDSAPSWYPEAYDFPVINPTGSCVVRYALRHSRLTRNGVHLAYGEDDEPLNPINGAWDDAWNSVDAPGMTNLKDALTVYSAYVQDCTEGVLANFSDATASSN